MKHIVLKLSDVSAKIFIGIPPARKWSVRIRQPMIPYINVKNIRNGNVEISKLDLVRVDNLDLNRYQIKKDDILLACRGTHPKTAIVQNEMENFVVTSPNIITVRLNEKLNPILLHFYLNCTAGNRQLFSKAIRTNTQYILTVTALSEMEIPVPPLEIQSQIIRLLSFINEQYFLSIKSADLRKQIMENLALDLMVGNKPRGFHE